ncbi:MAG: DUF456 domain-containing protein [Desulfovibrionaceae bacterium]|nr:DUF456 domain-containing protein [Desulfovibrionaceae bacterium]
MLYALVIVFVLALTLCALLNLISLPGNWVLAGLAGLWAVAGPGAATADMGTLFFVALFGLAAAGEVVEYAAQIWGAKKYGSSGRATVAGMIGTILGAIAGSPFLFGLGALFGALAGAWLGAFTAERLLDGRPASQAAHAANGALVGRFLGMVVKFGLGITMVVLTAAAIWPGRI